MLHDCLYTPDSRDLLCFFLQFHFIRTFITYGVQEERGGDGTVGRVCLGGHVKIVCMLLSILSNCTLNKAPKIFLSLSFSLSLSLTLSHSLSLSPSLSHSLTHTLSLSRLCINWWVVMVGSMQHTRMVIGYVCHDGKTNEKTTDFRVTVIKVFLFPTSSPGGGGL